MSTLSILLIVLVVFALAGGGWGYSRWGATGLSPIAVVAVILLGLYFAGRLH